MRQVPFFANTTDDTHCVQAAFRMVLKHFLPDKNFTFKDLDKMTKKQQGKGTWFLPMHIALTKIGFAIHDIETFNYQQFYKQGNAYVKERFSKEQADWYLKNSNLLAVKQSIPEYLKIVKHEIREATLHDFETFLDQGYLLMTDINGDALNHWKGYTSHAVVIYGHSKQYFYIHDPGNPPHKTMKISKKRLIRIGANNLSAYKH